MVETIQPKEYFPIARILTDHTDSSTYYVQAVVRNAKTAALIETVNLTDHGTRLFSYNWQAPVDTSGQGLFITITTAVYTDSGYSNRSDNYGDELSNYLVLDRFKTVQAIANQVSALVGGAGSDGSIEYEKIRKIVREENLRVIAEIKKIDPINYEAIRSIVASLTSMAAKPADVAAALKKLEPLVQSLSSAVAPLLPAIQGIDIPKLDLSPVLAAIERLVNAEAENTDIRKSTSEHLRVISDLPEIFKHVMGLLSTISGVKPLELPKHIPALAPRTNRRVRIDGGQVIIDRS